MYLTISPINETKPVNKINFGIRFFTRKVNNLSVDKFEAGIPKSLYNPQFEATVDRIFVKVEAAANTFTPQKLEFIISNLKTSFPNRTEKEIVSTLQRLTQWANYPSLKFVGEFMANKNIITNHSPEGINPLFNYFQASKGLLPYEGVSFLHNKSFFVTKDGINEAINFAKGLKPRDKDRTKFINLEGFDDGVNLFTDDEKLLAAAGKALKFIENNPKMSFKEAMNDYFNGDIVAKLKDIGVGVMTLRHPAPNTGREIILEQMAPYKVTKEDIRQTLQKIGLFYADSNKEYHFLTNNMAEYFEDQLRIYTKQFLIEGIKKLNVLINKFVAENNIKSKNVYYVIPQEGEKTVKSFDVITYMYKQQYNIPNSQIIKLRDITLLDEFKEKSAFVILDDFVESGNCYTSIANYDSSNAYLKSKNIHLLFCPVAGRENGLEHIKSNNFLKGREKFDHVLIPEDNIIKESLDNKAYVNLFDDITGRYIVGCEGYDVGCSCNVFPYMTPDNNPDLASAITRLFFPSPAPIKNCHQELLKVVKMNFSTLINRNNKLNL